MKKLLMVIAGSLLFIAGAQLGGIPARNTFTPISFVDADGVEVPRAAELYIMTVVTPTGANCFALSNARSADWLQSMNNLLPLGCE